MNHNHLKRGGMLLYGIVMLFFASCVEGYKDEFTWTSSVKNVTLESPAADQITVQFSADGTEQTIQWPLVPGAGGYLVSVYNMDDPDNPVAIGTADQVVDGVSVKRPSTEDTRFKVSIRTLGNPKNNNTEATTASEKLYDNMLAVTAVIPDGANLTEYFTANPIPANDTELCYELVAGGEYKMTGNVLLPPTTSVTIRGDKVDHASVEMTDGSFVNSGAGFKLKFTDLDYAGFTGPTSAVILMNSDFNAAGLPLTETGYLVTPTTSPVALQSCKITGLQSYIFFDNNQMYAIGTFLIKDCIIGFNSAFAAARIRFQRGMVKDLTITNSTVYNEVDPGADINDRLIQISSSHAGNVKPLTEIWASAEMTVTNCTFWQANKRSQSFNSNGAFGNAGDKVTVQKNVFVDSFERGRIVSRLRRGNTTATFTGGQNTQWWDGEMFPSNAQDATADVAYFDTDPQLTHLGNGEFRMTGAQQIAARTGDPRWLPAQ